MKNTRMHESPTRPWRAALAVVSALFVFAAPIHAQTAVQTDSPGWSPELRAAIPGLEKRLGALTPEDPRLYFELAEEVADESREPEDVALARQLYALAHQTDESRHQGRHKLAPSVCLGLADLENIEQTAAWLKAMAGAFDKRYVATDWNVKTRPSTSQTLALQAATVLGLVRAGEGRRALDLLSEPGVEELITRYEPLLSPTGTRSGLVRLRSQAAIWPCPECKNQRILPYRTQEGGVQQELCHTCHGDPGPELSPDELAAHLRFEVRLLSGLQSSWTAQLIVNQEAPLLDPEPDRLGSVLTHRYGVAAARPLWRNNQWTGESSTPAPTNDPADDNTEQNMITSPETPAPVAD